MIGYFFFQLLQTFSQSEKSKEGFSNSSIDLEGEKSITITTNDEMKLRNIYDILQSKLVKRGLSIKILDAQSIENALGGNVRQVFNLKKGLTQE